MDKILQFLRDNPFALLLVVGLLIIVVSVLDFTDAKNWNVQPAASPHYGPLTVGGVLLLAAIVTLFAGQKRPSFDLSGTRVHHIHPPCWLTNRCSGRALLSGIAFERTGRIDTGKRRLESGFCFQPGTRILEPRPQPASWHGNFVPNTSRFLFTT